MRLIDLLQPESVTLDLKAQGKKEALSELSRLIAAGNRLSEPDKVVDILMERESLGSTGIGQGIAIPHGKTEAVKEQVAALGISKRGVDFDALDGESVYIVFLLIAPPDAAGNHLKALAKISRLLKDKFFRQALRDARSVEEVLKIIREEDEY
ncbi:MAG: PTS sugar transporter subunit IIA [Elusimicrobiota bacterium]|jgi:nitrogen PTS system EIIA component